MNVQGTSYGLFQINLVTQNEEIARRLRQVQEDPSFALCHSGLDFQNIATRLPFPLIDGGSMEDAGFFSMPVEILSSPANQEDYPTKIYRVLTTVELVKCQNGDGLIAYGLDTKHGIPAPKWMNGTLKAGCGPL